MWNSDSWVSLYRGIRALCCLFPLPENGSLLLFFIVGELVWTPVTPVWLADVEKKKKATSLQWEYIYFIYLITQNHKMILLIQNIHSKIHFEKCWNPLLYVYYPGIFNNSALKIDVSTFCKILRETNNSEMALKIRAYLFQ